MLALILEPEAYVDIQDAHDWYESRRPGLGARFEAHVDQTLLWIAENAGLCIEHRPGIRKRMVRVFPYLVYFTATPDEIRVVAVLHGARDQAALRRRLES